MVSTFQLFLDPHLFSSAVPPTHLIPALKSINQCISNILLKLIHTRDGACKMYVNLMQLDFQVSPH